MGHSALPVRVWIALSLGVLGLSVIATGVRAARYPESVPRTIAVALEDFVEPGTAVWWLTLGGPFRTFPYDWLGYAVVVTANTAFWSLAGAFVVVTFTAAIHAVRRSRQAP